VSDVFGVHRREGARNDDHDEEREEPERDVVATQPAPGQVPGASPLDRDAVLFGRELCRGVESERGLGAGLVSSCRHWGRGRPVWGRPRSLPVSPSPYFVQIRLKSNWYSTWLM